MAGMSEEDYGATDVSLADVSTAGNGKQRKGPRFSWTPAYEATFFRSLCESVQLGLKDNHSFKAEAWDRAATALQKQHGAYPNKGHLINKSDNARKKFRLWRGLREDPDFLYNPSTRQVTGTDEAWRLHIEKEPLSRSLKGRPFDHEEFMEILFPDVIGSGGAPKRITKQRRKDTSGLQQLDDQDLSLADTANNSLLDMLGDTSFAAPTQHSLVGSALGFPTAAITQQSQHQSPMPPPQQLQSPLPPQQQLQQHQQQPPQRSIPSPAINSRASIASASALTPPDENPTPAAKTTRKRYPADQPSAPVDKRRRTTAAPNAFVDLSHPAQVAQAGGGVNARPPTTTTTHQAPQGVSATIAEDLLLQLSENVKQSRPLRWPEQAMEMFFREFCNEDMDLQVKIAEKVLTDPSKAMVFCKMPPEVRSHWVGRLRDIHFRAGPGV
ncbi:hypothetical protein MCOR02_006820 [Pyricularia oryzae]|uniref:Myb/SANT-like domain-containing protein n=1 Tax=Pyricularia oryzae TaxID=318829 RepID=A0A4P7NS20_PYROR|nr:hypothetical protein MCOR02_006820 [Pyricularia oryzae]KAI6311617.1 hypothetical protein MCOR34_005963 [Pyricularia oryzae]KAI6474978.1 hypothetical protein MCOR17_001793 [Pyricularia oryzae]KAI6509320.1 hypothetical protein MCOR13_001679 [Pyricularia oryzae]KAI6550097.1 hypothetical protein MCOR04_011325 [Pyricularia oryzae]